MKSGSRLPWWLAMWVGGILVVTATAILILILISKNAVEKRRTELINLGEPLDIASLEPEKFPEENNGGPSVVAAATELASLQKKHSIGLVSWGPSVSDNSIVHKRPAARGKDGEVEWSEVDARMEILRESLSQIRTATRSPVLGVNLDYAPGINMKTDFLSFLGVAQFLAIDTVLSLRNGNSAEALQNIETQLHLAQIAAYHPTHISLLTGSSLMMIASKSTWEFLECDSATAADLEHLQKLWEKIHLSRCFADSMRMERAFAQPTYEQWQLRSLNSPGDLMENLKLLSWGTFFRHSDELRFLNDFQDVINECKPTTPTDWRKLSAVTKEIDKSLQTGGIERTWSKMFYGVLLKFQQRILVSESLQKLTVTAIAIRRYQLQHDGVSPPSLDALLPDFLSALPLDPINGEPLRYQADGSDFLLYSIGTDGIDGKGDLTPLPDFRKSDWITLKDLVWPRPAKPAPATP